MPDPTRLHRQHQQILRREDRRNGVRTALGVRHAGRGWPPGGTARAQEGGALQEGRQASEAQREETTPGRPPAQAAQERNGPEVLDRGPGVLFQSPLGLQHGVSPPGRGSAGQTVLAPVTNTTTSVASQNPTTGGGQTQALLLRRRRVPQVEGHDRPGRSHVVAPVRNRLAHVLRVNVRKGGTEVVDRSHHELAEVGGD